MKTDRQGCSTCPAGQERFETFHVHGLERVQYDYRTESGVLFSTVGKSLDDCRARRDNWIQDLVDPHERLGTYCDQCHKPMNPAEAMLGPVCGECCRENHRRAVS